MKKLSIFGLLFVVSTMTFSAPRPKELVTEFKQGFYGVFLPNSPLYNPEMETITAQDVQDTLGFLKQLKNNAWLRDKCSKADPSLAALLTTNGFYPALSTRYRYELLMDGNIPEQEPPWWDAFAKYIRGKSQGSAMARVIRNRFRYFEKYISKALHEDITQPKEPKVITIANLGSAAGDEVSAAVSRLTMGTGTKRVRQFLYDIDQDAMELGVVLAKKYYHYDVSNHGDFNLIDLNNLSGISEHIRANGISWVHSSGFFMSYKVEKAPGVFYTHQDKANIFKAYCQGGVKRISFSADHEHPLPRFIVDAGWKNFELDFPHDEILAMMGSIGYKLDKLEEDNLEWLRLYYFKGECP